MHDTIFVLGIDSLINLAKIKNTIGINDIKDFVIIATSCFGVCVALSGLTTWKRQIRGTNEYELAKRLLMGIYRVRNGIGVVRHPLFSSSEALAALKKQGNTLSEQLDAMGKEGTIAAYSIRWEYLQNALIELNVIYTEAEVIWGKEIKENIDKLYKKVNILRTMISSYFEDEFGGKKIDKSRDNVYKIVHGFCNDDDETEYWKEITTIIKSIEEYLKPKLRGKNNS